jgi:hypothetical protein
MFSSQLPEAVVMEAKLKHQRKEASFVGDHYYIFTPLG